MITGDCNSLRIKYEKARVQRFHTLPCQRGISNPARRHSQNTCQVFRQKPETTFKQAGRRTGMRATLVSFLEQPPFATSDIIGHMTISFVIHAVLRYGHSKFSKMAAAILDLVQPEVGPFDPPSPKTPPRIKQEVDRTIRSRDMAI